MACRTTEAASELSMRGPPGAPLRADAAQPVRHAHQRRLWLPAALLTLALSFALGESAGWPFLAVPLQSQLQQRSGRSVQLQTTAANAVAANPFSLHFWGGIHVQSAQFEIGAPAWSSAPYLLSAQGLDVRLRYGDAWRAWQGQPLVVQGLSADQLTLYLERTADGRASWQETLGGSTPQPLALPRVEQMEVGAGRLHYNDLALALSLDVALTLSSLQPTAQGASAPLQRVLRARASGHYREDAVRLSLLSTGALPWEAAAGQGPPVAVTLAASLGPASLDFEGTALDFLHLKGLDGAFRVQGSSLAAIAAPLGLTLPTTPPFQASGQLQRSGAQWTLALHSARVGASQLSGAFVFDAAARPPRLNGTLNGTRFLLADLAPALGAPVGTSAGAPRARVLPTRRFDLAALRAMDADVQIAIAQVDANLAWLEPLRPFAAHLQLRAGVLTLTGIEARTAQGHLGGTLALDGQQDRAHWVAALHWDGVQLQRWLHQTRAAGLPPYLSGQLQGHATLQGSGRSTAEILATLQGDIGATVVHGTLSHLLVEMGGLDLAESLGVWAKGDNALVLDCALADLSVVAGTLRPRLLVLDTSDSTVWVDGTLSLATEQLDLRAVVAPKDFSLLTLRAPLQLRGSFAHPVVTVDKGPVGLKLGSALLLGLLNPLAALLPLVDVGNQQAARASAASCQARMHQKVQRARPEQPVPKRTS
jgi:uncharacterized protein involved in outer membrane biogenesis